MLLAAALVVVAASSPPPTPDLTVRERLFAGGTARALSQATLYPADALRTLAQTRAGAKGLSELGARTLISGCATTSAFAYGIGAVQFAAYGTVAPALGSLCASIVAALASCSISIPQEVLKQRLVTGIYPSFRVAVSSIWAAEGARGFYAGWLPTVSRNVPFVVTTFTLFGALENRALRKSGMPVLDAATSVRLGVTSALFAAFATQPFDVVKTRMVTQAASTAVPYRSVADCVTTMWRTEGPGAFYTGLRQRSLYSGPLWAMQFGLNTRISRALRERKQRGAT